MLAQKVALILTLLMLALPRATGSCLGMDLEMLEAGWSPSKPSLCCKFDESRKKVNETHFFVKQEKFEVNESRRRENDQK